MREPDGWPESELQHSVSKDCLKAYKFLQSKAHPDNLAHWFWMVKENPLGTLDSWETATAKRYTLPQLRAVAARAKRLLKDIEQLRGTPLVMNLVAYRQIGRADLLHPSLDYLEAFPGLLQIGSHGRRFGPKARPQFNQNLWFLLRYVYECHRSWHDRCVALVMEGLGLKPDDEDNLKVWRRAHGLTTERVRQNFL